MRRRCRPTVVDESGAYVHQGFADSVQLIGNSVDDPLVSGQNMGPRNLLVKSVGIEPQAGSMSAKPNDVAMKSRILALNIGSMSIIMVEPLRPLRMVAYCMATVWIWVGLPSFVMARLWRVNFCDFFF